MEKKVYSEKYESINNVMRDLSTFYYEESIPCIVETLETFLDKYDPEDRALGKYNGPYRNSVIVLTYSCLFYLLSKYYTPKPDITIDKIYDYFNTYINSDKDINTDKLIDNAMLLFGDRTPEQFKFN